MIARAEHVLGVALLMLARPMLAQCPDGTPPPCAGAAARGVNPHSVAVLYLDNLSRDTADAYLADGLTEEVIIRLGQMRRLEVKSRFEVARFRGRSARQDPTVLGRQLRVAYLVIGSAQRAGDRVRVRYEVVRAATGAQVGGDVIDRASSDLLTVESDIAREVATAITGELRPAERSRLARPLTADPAAYEEYLRGLQALQSTYDEPALRSALAHLDRAIARDSGFAAALAAQALAWTELADGYVSPREGYGRARAAAVRALAHDSSQALAVAVLASAALSLDLDARTGEQLGRRAVTIDPRSDQSHSILSSALFVAGRLDEAIEEARLAWQCDSLLSNNGIWYVQALILGHRFDTAAAFLPRIRAILPPADADAAEGMLQAAEGNLRGAATLLSWRYYGGLVAGAYVRALLAQGDTAAARLTVDSMVAARGAGYYNPIAIAKAYAALGDVDSGIAWLHRAFDERTLWLTYVRQDDELAPLRRDPRYAALDAQWRF